MTKNAKVPNNYIRKPKKNMKDIFLNSITSSGVTLTHSLKEVLGNATQSRTIETRPLTILHNNTNNHYHNLDNTLQKGNLLMPPNRVGTIKKYHLETILRQRTNNSGLYAKLAVIKNTRNKIRNFKQNTGGVKYTKTYAQVVKDRLIACIPPPQYCKRTLHDVECWYKS